MRTVLQCIPLKTMADLAVLEDFVDGALGRERVMITGSSAVLRAILLELCADLRPALERNTARGHALLVPQVMCTLGFKQRGHSRGSWPTDWDSASQP